MSAQGPDELRAVHAARRELGPDYDDALLDSFVDRAEAQLRQRLENDRPAAQRGPAPKREPLQVTLGPGGLALAVLNGVWGVLSGVLLPLGLGGSGALQILVVWFVLVVTDAAYIGALIARRSDERRNRDRTATTDAPTSRPAPRQRPRGSTTT